VNTTKHCAQFNFCTASRLMESVTSSINYPYSALYSCMSMTWEQYECEVAVNVVEINSIVHAKLQIITLG